MGKGQSFNPLVTWFVTVLTPRCLSTWNPKVPALGPVCSERTCDCLRVTLKVKKLTCAAVRSPPSPGLRDSTGPRSEVRRLLPHVVRVASGHTRSVYLRAEGIATSVGRCSPSCTEREREAGTVSSGLRPKSEVGCSRWSPIGRATKLRPHSPEDSGQNRRMMSLPSRGPWVVYLVCLLSPFRGE